MMLFEVGVRMERTLENGAHAKVLEQFVVDALSFTEAEASTTKEVSVYGTMTDIVTIKRSRCTELIGDGSKEKWFKAKLAFITLDEKTDKEKRTPVTYLVQAASLDKARAYVKEVMEKTLIDYDVISISETHFIDVFEHNNQ